MQQYINSNFNTVNPYNGSTAEKHIYNSMMSIFDNCGPVQIKTDSRERDVFVFFDIGNWFSLQRHPYAFSHNYDA